MFRKRKTYVGAVLVVALAISLGVSDVGAACVAEGEATKAGEAGLVLHLPPTCTQAEREAHSLRGERIVDALRKGHSVDLVGVIIQGDILFDRLTPQVVPQSSMTSELPSRGKPARSEEERRVPAGLRIRDSVVQGAVRHRSVSSTLRFEGPVDFQGSRFNEGVDLSWSVFQEAVDLSGAVFEKEAHFVQEQFVGPLACRETRFGPSTRFHRSAFRGSVDCTGALFDRMAEFWKSQLNSRRSLNGRGSAWGQDFPAATSRVVSVFATRSSAVKPSLPLRSSRGKPCLPVPNFWGLQIFRMPSSGNKTILFWHASIIRPCLLRQSGLSYLNLTVSFRPRMVSMSSPSGCSSRQRCLWLMR
ncbi:MAG: pentapeptide repeat-containing protein [Nitrospira sp.]|nr:pentapeptide repeat-containing protein [Nitrospira sp.]